MNVLVLLVMLQLLGLFRGLNLENKPYKFGEGNLYRVISPLGFVIALLVSKEELGNKNAWIIGVIFTLVLIGLFFLI